MLMGVVVFALGLIAGAAVLATYALCKAQEDEEHEKEQP